MSMALDLIVTQNKYAGLDVWHNAGFTGKGVVIWNTEGGGDHAETVTTRLKNAAPEATIYMAGLEMSSDATQVFYANVSYNGTKYQVEDFIKQFNVNVVTRSIGGGTAEGRPESIFWNTLKDKYDLVFFNSASNDGTPETPDGETTGGAFPPDVAYWIAACNLTNGKPVRASYSSVGHDVDFINFTGVWSGTSFAAPYTAGEAALLKGRYGKDMCADEIFKYLVFISEDLIANGVGFDNYSGWGIPRFPAITKKYITLDVGKNTYKVDGIAYPMDTAPVNKEGNVFVPLRVISEALGKTVNWAMNPDKTIKITITDATNTVVLNTGSTTMTKNGTKIILNFAPYIDANNRTLVPIRAIAEAFNCKVDWVQKKARVMILEK